MKKYKLSFIVMISSISLAGFMLVLSSITLLKTVPVSGQESQLCTSTGGEWGYIGGGSQLACACPTDTIWTSTDGCATDNILCANSGGEWVYDGSSQRCICPPGKTLFASRCQDNEDSEGNSITGINGDDSGGEGLSRDELSNGDCDVPPGEDLNRSNCGIINIAVISINILSAIAGIVLIASLMIAGFTYMTAQDDPGKVQKAKSRIVMTLIALVLFIFMYALLNFLVPGGVL